MHNNTKVGVWDRIGQGKKKIKSTFPLPEFSGHTLEGEWTLHIVDYVQNDVGVLNHWTLAALIE